MVDLTAVPGGSTWEAYLANFSPELAGFLTELVEEPRVQCLLSASADFLEGCRLIGQVPEEVVNTDSRWLQLCQTLQDDDKTWCSGQAGYCGFIGARAIAVLRECSNEGRLSPKGVA